MTTPRFRTKSAHLYSSLLSSNTLFRAFPNLALNTTSPSRIPTPLQLNIRTLYIDTLRLGNFRCDNVYVLSRTELLGVFAEGAAKEGGGEV
jgi:hypothetical protein